MSGLIEKVARGICLADEQNGAAPYEYRMQNKHTALAVNDQARAAIAAVAEWLDEQPLETGHEPYDMAIAKLWKQLEKSK